MSKHETQSPYAVPAAIVAAGLMIAAAIFAGGGAAAASAPVPAPAARAAAPGCGV